MSKVLIVAPHPDDEAIGCGGAIREHVLAGDEVHTLFLSSGELGLAGDEPLEETAARREREAEAASRILGSTIVGFWKLPDGQVAEHKKAAAGRLADLLRRGRPELIYVTHHAEAHVDHQAAAEIVSMALGLAPTCHAQRRLYEVWTPLVDYDQAIDISPYLAEKLAAIRAHECQVSRIRFDQAALALARFRGELHNRPHGPYAEVFAWA